jgi:hypothetical protein
MTATRSFRAVRSLEVVAWIGGGVAIATQMLGVALAATHPHLAISSQVRAPSSGPLVFDSEWVEATIRVVPTSAQRVAYFGVLLLAVALTTVAVVGFISLLRLIRRQDFFSQKAVSRIQILASTAVGAWIVGLLLDLVGSEMITSDAVRSGVSVNPMWLVIALALGVMARAVDEGKSYREDSEGLI